MSELDEWVNENKEMLRNLILHGDKITAAMSTILLEEAGEDFDDEEGDSS